MWISRDKFQLAQTMGTEARCDNGQFVVPNRSLLHTLFMVGTTPVSILPLCKPS
ncbi:hypothetical protein RRG08_033050 [Elysia crispata]|uniref:Uncharacterized protein n=1 Tax=Elysia crispata TaxID=231223 RepID=A0AAE1A6X5_9GAST|nr:hypothetical protein RRG08_033050 [Elysia crispata]